MEGMEGLDMKRGKQETLEVTGVSRSGRVRKKSSKLVDFESPDEVEARQHKRKSGSHFESPGAPPKPKKIPKAPKPKADGPEERDMEENEDEEDPSFHLPGDDSESSNERSDFELEDQDDEDDSEDDGEGNLVVDEKSGVSQSLYMMEKRRKMGRDGKTQRKDKGKARFTAYMMWAKEIRHELNKQYPEMDFTTMARRLSELWSTVPNSERILWRRKAKKASLEKQKRETKPDAPLMPSRKFINKKGGPIQPPVTLNSRPPVPAPPSPQVQQKTVPRGVEPPQSPVRKPVELMSGPGLYKVTGIAAIDVAAHLKLLGESLSIIGERLQEHEGQIAVSGSLSVLLDSLLCAVGPLLCLTQQVEQIKTDKQVLMSILNNVAYMMPGLG